MGRPLVSTLYGSHALVCRVTRDSDHSTWGHEEDRAEAFIADIVAAWGAAGPSPAAGILMTSARQESAVGPPAAAVTGPQGGSYALPPLQASTPLRLVPMREHSSGEAAGRPVYGVIVRVRQLRGRGLEKQQAAAARRLKRSNTI